jgi:hypothetical protein
MRGGLRDVVDRPSPHSARSVRSETRERARRDKRHPRP